MQTSELLRSRVRPVERNHRPDETAKFSVFFRQFVVLASGYLLSSNFKRARMELWLTITIRAKHDNFGVRHDNALTTARNNLSLYCCTGGSCLNGTRHGWVFFSVSFTSP